MKIPPPPYIVVCDFDGTITVEDVTNMIWDAHLPFDWRQELVRAEDGAYLPALELITRGYAGVGAPAAQLLAEVRPRVRIRDGWGAFVEACRARAWPLEVVSHGLGFYIRELLPAGVSITSFEATFEPGVGPGGAAGWRVSLPAGTTLAPGGDFKSDVVAGLRAAHPGHAVIYVGDGRLDFPAARRSDAIFAVRDSTLARFCRTEGVAHVEFGAFDEVAAALTSPFSSPPTSPGAA